MTDLSIIVVSYNTQYLTAQCLRSIYESAGKVSFEIWVVDNNSSDGSADVVERDFPDVHLIRNKDNKGLAAATNQGLEQSRGRYAVALNSDTVILDSAFEKLVKFMDDHPDVGGVTPKLLLPDKSLHPWFVGNRPNLKSELADAFAPISKKLSAGIPELRFGKYTDPDRTQEVPCILWGTCFLVRDEILKTVGLQDPRFFVYGEDTDWAMRIGEAGWKLFYFADAAIIHYGGQSTKQAGARMSAQLCKSRSRLIQQHYGLWAGSMLRLAFASLSMVWLLRWLPAYAFSSSSREKATDRISRNWAIIRAVLTY
jgi:hypothetical protein